MATFQPFSTRREVMAMPIPEFPPVTIATGEEDAMLVSSRTMEMLK